MALKGTLVSTRSRFVDFFRIGSVYEAESWIQGPLKERFSRAPFVKYSKGDTSGLVGFDKALSEEDLAYVKEHIATLGSKVVTWEVPSGKRNS